MAPDLHFDETRFWRGIRLFNERAFFDAHEVLEDVWREAPEQDRAFLQGLIQIAVALHHHSRGNLVGAASLLARGQKNLSPYGDAYGEVDLAKLRRDIEHWRDALAHQQPPPPWPQLLRLDAKIGSR